MTEQPGSGGLRDEMTGELVLDNDGQPIGELVGHDYLRLADSMTLEERAAGERAWRYGHVIVDEAQDLTPMQWRMVARRARGHSMTIVGDLAQRSNGPPGRWDELLPAELGPLSRFDLTINYRSPDEISRLANRVLAHVAPDLRPPSAIRESGEPVRFIEVDDLATDLPAIVEAELEAAAPSRVAVIGIGVDHLPERDRLIQLSPRQAKGMEFDSVVVVEPADIVEQAHGLSLLYIALTRSTERLTFVHARPLPDVLRGTPSEDRVQKRDD